MSVDSFQIWQDHIDNGRDIPASDIRCPECPMIRIDVVQPPCGHESRRLRAVELTESMRLAASLRSRGLA